MSASSKDWFKKVLKPFQPKDSGCEKVFTKIYRKNSWGSKDSVSGTGSDNIQTREISQQLPTVLAQYEIASMLDIPCGDFNWMQHVELGNVSYTGADIVSEIIERNRAEFGNDLVRFAKLDLTKSQLPQVDLIFCRDCLVHLCFDQVLEALKNICESKSRYLLTTTFTNRETNEDIPTGKWRTLNMEKPPLSLPKPLQIINEGCTENDGIFSDKAMGLWAIAEIRESLFRE